MISSLVWAAVAITILQATGTESLHCFHCSNVLENQDCASVTHCTGSQSCYSERTGIGNQTRFNFGCIESEQCPVHHDFTIVGRSTQRQCLECCLQDGCNKALCELQHVSDVHNPSTCADDPASNCTQLSKLINICSDVPHAKNVCRKYCGLCSLVDGDWNKWSEWTPCSTSCGVGTHIRKRNCTDPVPQNGGSFCSGNDTEIHSCFLRDCPVHGEWSNWGSWEACSVSCGDGIMKRHRTCTNPSPSLYGHYCIGDPVDFDACHKQACGNLTTSSVIQHHSCRDVSTECDLLNKTVSVCGQQEQARKICASFCGLCSIVDGQWASWSVWSTCSTTCNNGTWARTRTCTDPSPANGGKSCAGNNSETSICNLRLCPVHGGWSTWAQWETCSSSCGQGITKRYRSCTNPRPSLLGNNCFGDSTEYGMCLIKHCPVDGQWTEWSPWFGCSVTCGDGQKTRKRYCSNPGPANGGLNCQGAGSEQTTCHMISCPVNGGWTSWSSWSTCSRSCNGGEQKRNRSCSNPSPNELGKPCIGISAESAICNGHSCSGYQIGFSASGDFVDSNLIVKFTNIINNYGSGYSSVSGKFTCSHPGLYYFSTSLVKAFEVDFIHCYINRNTSVLINTRIDPADGDTDKGLYETSAFVVVHLSRDQEGLLAVIGKGMCTENWLPRLEGLRTQDKHSI